MSRSSTWLIVDYKRKTTGESQKTRLWFAVLLEGALGPAILEFHNSVENNEPETENNHGHCTCKGNCFECALHDDFPPCIELLS